MGRPGRRSRSWGSKGVATACVLCWLPLACGAAQREAERGVPKPSDGVAAIARLDSSYYEYPDATWSPQKPGTDAPTPFWPARCALRDGALVRVAERVARRRCEGAAALDSSELGFALRAAGAPYVAARAWTLEGVELESSEAARRLDAWLDSWSDEGERRCGVAVVRAHGRRVLGAVAVDALADLDPVPVRVRAGSWVEIGATLLVSADAVKVVVLGPNGSPAPLPTSFDGQRARARFAADRPGSYLIQLLASAAQGPLPALEAALYADVDPPRSFAGEPAPGEPEDASGLSPDAAQALLSMLNSARRTQGSPLLVRDARLDAIAQRHAEAMRSTGRVAHDAGDGDPQARIEASAVPVLLVGENVAHAGDTARVHRVLWASPSHRANLLQARFDTVGIGVAPDTDGSIWACELFADFPAQSGAEN